MFGVDAILRDAAFRRPFSDGYLIHIIVIFDRSLFAECERADAFFNPGVAL